MILSPARRLLTLQLVSPPLALTPASSSSASSFFPFHSGL